MSDELKNLPEEGMLDDMPTFITLTDEDGTEVELEYVDTLEFNGSVYMAFFPTVPEDVDPDTLEDDEEYGLILMKVVEIDGEEQLETISDEAELDAVYEYFMNELFEEEDEE